MLSSTAWKPRPTTTTQTSASPLGVAPDAMVAAGCPRKLMLFPAPGPHRVTHLAKKCLPMRHPISTHALNPLKKRRLKPHD